MSLIGFGLCAEVVQEDAGGRGDVAGVDVQFVPGGDHVAVRTLLEAYRDGPQQAALGGR